MAGSYYLYEYYRQFNLELNLKSKIKKNELSLLKYPRILHTLY